MRSISLLILVCLLFVSCTAEAKTSAEIIAQFKSGQKLTLGIVGNSIGCGYYATNYNLIAADINNPSIGSWANGLRAFLKAANPQSDVVNLSQNGWYLQQHLDANTVSLFGSPPDAVIFPLQINDYCAATYGRPWSEYTANIRTVAQQIIDSGAACIMVMENDIGRVAPRADGKTYLDFVNEARKVALEKGCTLIDCYTPFHKAITATGNYATTGLYYDDIHPNQTGHDLILTQYKNWLNGPPSQKTDVDYLRRINTIKTGYLDATWNASSGWYESANGYGVQPFTWLNAFMVQTTAILAGRGVATGTDIARANTVIAKLISAPAYTSNNTWTHSMTGVGDYHEAVDAPVAESLYFCWKYRAALGLDTATINSIVNILTVNKSVGFTGIYKGFTLDITNLTDNQSTSKWMLNRLTYAYLVNGSHASDLSTLLKRFVSEMDTTVSGGAPQGGTALFPDFGWRYLQSMPWQSFEYGSMCLGAGLLYYPEIASALNLTAGEMARMKAWQRQIMGQWQRNGYPNWDTTWSDIRIHALSYWVWSLRAMLGMTRATDLDMNATDALYAKSMLDNALDTMASMDSWAGDPAGDYSISKQPFGTADNESVNEGVKQGYNNAKANGMAKMAMELAVAVDLGIADAASSTPTNIWGWSWSNLNVDVSTSTYSAASLPYAPAINYAGSDAVQSPGDGVSRIQLPTNEILTSLGGYGQESFSFRIVKDGTTEIDTGNISAGKPTTQQVWLDGISQFRTNYDTTPYSTTFTSSLRTLVTRNGTNYRSEADTVFYPDHITQTYRAVKTGTAGTGQVVHSFPCRKNVVMDYVPVSGSKTTIWNGTTLNAAGSPDASSCKYIHLKWSSVPGSGISAGLLLVPRSGTVAAGAKVTALSYNPNGYPLRQPDQDRSLLIYLADSATSMDSVDLTYDIWVTDGTDAGASVVYAAAYSSSAMAKLAATIRAAFR